MDILNLDELVKVQKTLRLNGVEHKVVELSVENFLAALDEANKLEQEGVSAAENIGRTIVHITRVIPSLAEADIRALTVPQLTALIAFVNGTVKEQAADAPVGDAGNAPAPSQS